MRKLFVSFATCLAIVAAASAQKRNITEKDLWDFVWVGDPQVSPDGSRVAFVRVTVNCGGSGLPSFSVARTKSKNFPSGDQRGVES